MARAAQHAAGLGLQRRYVAGLDQILGGAVGVGEFADGQRAVLGRDARAGDLARVDRDADRSAARALGAGDPPISKNRPVMGGRA